jgi:hypothetical protein
LAADCGDYPALNMDLLPSHMPLATSLRTFEMTSEVRWPDCNSPVDQSFEFQLAVTPAIWLLTLQMIP